ncbi:MAG TPA: RNA-binding protein [Candidatus Methanomethylophilaceae archaeon]|nr:RNA-binding protein [Candidatus Methanomethylophilaceae archaeon]
MKGLKELLDVVEKRFTAAENSRENVIRSSREIIRSSKKIIHSIHEGKLDGDEVDNISELVKKLTIEIDMDAGLLRSGPASDALSEYAEAIILKDVLSSGKVPSFIDLGIDERSWVLGLADTVGELRRIVLKNLMDGDLDGAVSIFEMMEDIADGILMFDVPDAVVPIRRKQDIARGIIERTRSDITTAVVISKK